jgi:hypothetical protein
LGTFFGVCLGLAQDTFLKVAVIAQDIGVLQPNPHSTDVPPKPNMKPYLNLHVLYSFN